MKHRWMAWALAGAILVTPYFALAPHSFADDAQSKGAARSEVTSNVFGSAEGRNLKDHGFIEGGDGGALMETSLLTREQLAILTAQLMGEDAKARAFQVASGYEDETEFPNWSRSYISYSKVRGWMKGDAGKFNNKGFVSAEELAIVLLRALGYAEAKWGTNVETLAHAGIDFQQLGVMGKKGKPAEYKVTRGQTFVAMWEAVSKTVTKSGECLGVKLGKIQNPLDELRINRVKVVSYKEFHVEFSREMSILNTEDLKVVAGSPQKIAKIERIDELTFRVTLLNNLPRNTKVTVKGESVFVSKLPTSFSVEYTFDPKDEVNPELVSITRANETRLVLGFSETIGQRLGGVAIRKNGQEVGATYAVKGSEVHVTLQSYLEPGDKLTITVERFVDEAGNELPYTEREYRVPAKE